MVDQANGNLSISELILGYMNHAEGYYINYGTKHQGEISNTTLEVASGFLYYGNFA